MQKDSALDVENAGFPMTAMATISNASAPIGNAPETYAPSFSDGWNAATKGISTAGNLMLSTKMAPPNFKGQSAAGCSHLCTGSLPQHS